MAKVRSLHKYIDKVSKLPIRRIIYNKSYPDTFTIYFQTDQELVLSADGDCCSHNSFSIFNENIEGIQNKYIKEITYETNYEYVPVYNYGCDEQYIVNINFTDNTTYEFYFDHSCNGYYSGWIDSEFIDC